VKKVTILILLIFFMVLIFPMTADAEFVFYSLIANGVSFFLGTALVDYELLLWIF